MGPNKVLLKMEDLKLQVLKSKFIQPWKQKVERRENLHLNGVM